MRRPRAPDRRSDHRFAHVGPESLAGPVASRAHAIELPSPAGSPPDSDTGC
jgi:hypothetical protein